MYSKFQFNVSGEIVFHCFEDHSDYLTILLDTEVSPLIQCVVCVCVCVCVCVGVGVGVCKDACKNILWQKGIMYWMALDQGVCGMCVVHVCICVRGYMCTRESIDKQFQFLQNKFACGLNTCRTDHHTM